MIVYSAYKSISYRRYRHDPIASAHVGRHELRGLAPKTQEAYVTAVRQLAAYYDKSPEFISEQELREYFLFLKNEKKVARSTCTQALCGIKFFYEQTLQREWQTFDLVRPGKEHKLPVVLAVNEVHRILGQLRHPGYRACLSVIYGCGLRLQEGTGLQVHDVDSERMSLHIRHAKGNRDRYVPLPDKVLPLLRAYWLTHRHPTWLFPAQTVTAAQETVSPAACSGPSRPPCKRVASTRPPPSTRCATVGPPICWKPASTCV
ncbi:MAG: site-specific integrase [Chloroflexi bacterium]|nr:site-specific integrase [Chloroflexota bacterium]